MVEPSSYSAEVGLFRCGISIQADSVRVRTEENPAEGAHAHFIPRRLGLTVRWIASQIDSSPGGLPIPSHVVLQAFAASASGSAANSEMSAFGPKQTSLVAPHMSAFGGKADIDQRDDDNR